MHEMETSQDNKFCGLIFCAIVSNQNFYFCSVIFCGYTHYIQYFIQEAIGHCILFTCLNCLIELFTDFLALYTLIKYAQPVSLIYN